MIAGFNILGPITQQRNFSKIFLYPYMIWINTLKQIPKQFWNPGVQKLSEKLTFQVI